MPIEVAVNNTLAVLGDTLNKIENSDYNRPCKELNGASIGEHYRHILEIFECLISGYSTGVVSYDKRKRDRILEQDKNVALNFIHELKQNISNPEKPIKLAACYSESAEIIEYFPTTFHRELAYAMEHAIHHMAILKIAFKFMLPDLKLPEHFGVAPSTIRHKAVPAQ
jgi:hypothetical protein